MNYLIYDTNIYSLCNVRPFAHSTMGKVFWKKISDPSKLQISNSKNMNRNFQLFFFSKLFFLILGFFHSVLAFPHYLVLESQSNNFRPRTSTNGLKGHYTSKLGLKKAASHINTNNCVISLLGKHLVLGATVQNVIFYHTLFYFIS